MAEENEGTTPVIPKTVEDDSKTEEEQHQQQYNEDAAEAARAQAEKRRQRILEKANNRMQYVDGSAPQDEEEKKESLSKAARIRAARQRRYGKKSAAAAPAPATATATIEPESGGASAAEAEAESKPDESTSETSEPKKEEPVEQQPDKVEAAPSDECEESASAPIASTDSSEPKKKYVGVARMRRRMLMKKKMEEENNNNDDSNGPGSSAAAGSGAASSVAGAEPTSSRAASVASKQSLTKVQRVPIYMHMIVILLMFVAGFDVGVQQFHAEVDVRNMVAVKEYGVPFVQRNPWHPLTPTISSSSSSSTETDSKQKALKDKLMSSSSASSSSTTGDEFGQDETIDEEYTPPVIDPIFRVDLDEMTKGPGIFNQMARGAISIHRLMLWLFYYAPLGFFWSILSIPTTLIQTPPALFLIAIVLRQVVGKAVLGASIPEESKEDGADGTKQNKIEVIGMAKTMVKGFFHANFPTLVTVYDVYLHVKSDMYVVFCGVFFGLAWTHLHSDPESCAAGSADDGYAGAEL
mmetsp:Transcript_12539/g.35599  ORF Transcript_12539/g.35599 Transcript_12539/m.35599 type:complete len:524 (-) Transcript_12539:32-1603(-)